MARLGGLFALMTDLQRTAMQPYTGNATIHARQ